MFIRDSAAATSHDVSPEGFLRVRARIGRVGLHDYRAEELGLPPGFGPGDQVRVYRPPDEVFDPASMDSFRAKPVTDDHPPEMVDARNWKRYAIGHSGHEVVRDGDHLATDLYIADAGAAERALKGAELSNGYHADFVFGAGTTPDGDAYDAVQRNIRGNHVALVDAGRCGGSCRIGEPQTDGCSCAPTGDASADAAGAVADRQQASDVKQSAPPAIAASLPDAVALDVMVQDRLAVIETARRVIGPSFDGKGRSTTELRRLVVARKLGDDHLADRSDAYVTAAFDTLVALQVTANPLATHLATGLRDASATRETALAARDRYLNRAWTGEFQQGEH